MSEFRLPCNCNWSVGCGPNLLCPVHGSSHHLAATLTETRAENQRLRRLMDTAKVVEREHAFLERISLLEAAELGFMKTSLEYKRRIALLEAAIKQHMRGRQAKNGYDKELYAVLQEQGE